MKLFARLQRSARALPGFSVLAFIKNVAVGGDSRSSALLRWRAPAGLLQPSGYTEPDRYPEIFTYLKSLVGCRNNLTVLSFGCSTGDEIKTVLQYFPSATIVGIDIDAGRIATCRARMAGIANTSFRCAPSAREEPAEAYDIVLAMAVLRHGELNKRPQNSSEHLTFSDFQTELAPLLNTVKPGGYLVVRHANFRVLDHPQSAALEPLQMLPAWGPLYGPDNEVTADIEENVIFQKR